MPSTPRSGFDETPDGSVLGAGLPYGEAGPTPLSLFGFEFSLDTASLDQLEQVARAVTRAHVAELFSRFARTEEVALLSTCHRVELLVVARTSEEVGEWQAALPGGRESWRLRWGRDVVSHVFRVAAGRESLAFGEVEARHQVRSAVSSVVSRHPRPILGTLLLEAARSAEEIAPAGSDSPSIAAIAATRLLRLVSSVRPHVVVVGAGTVGRQVVRTLAPSARVTVVFHERPPDESFLRGTDARAVGLDRLREAVAEADAVITAAKFGNHGLHAADLPRGRPLVLMDIGVPRNIDPEVRALPNVSLVDLEELHRLAQAPHGVEPSDERLESLAEDCSDRIERLMFEPWVEHLRRSAELVRRSELATARPFLGRLDADQEHAIELLTRRLVARLMQPPTERLRSLASGPEGDAQRRWALELLRPDAPDP